MVQIELNAHYPRQLPTRKIKFTKSLIKNNYFFISTLTELVFKYPNSTSTLEILNK